MHFHQLNYALCKARVKDIAARVDNMHPRITADESPDRRKYANSLGMPVARIMRISAEEALIEWFLKSIESDFRNNTAYEYMVENQKNMEVRKQLIKIAMQYRNNNA